MSAVDKVVRATRPASGLSKIKALGRAGDEINVILVLGGQYVQLPNGRMNGSEPAASKGDSPGGGSVDHSLASTQAIMKAYVKGPVGDTQRQFQDPTTGQWSPERAAVHEEILKEAMARAVGVPQDRQAIMMGGLPGAGKSTVTGNPEFADKLGMKMSEDGKVTNFATVNPDDFKVALAERGMVPEVPGGAHLSPMERSAAIHEESSYLAKAYQEALQRQGTNILLDGTMASTRSVAGKLEQLNSGKNPSTGEVDSSLGGYKTTTAFMSITPEESAVRAQARYEGQQRAYEETGKGVGGRIVPPEAIQHGENGMRSPNEQAWHDTRNAPGVTRSLLFDNMVPKGSTAVLLRDSHAGT